MENYHLPADLQQLERDLAGRPRPDPPAELRQRVIQGVRAELQGNGSGNRWTFAAGVAAAVVVWVNLSMSATLATDYGSRPTSPRLQVDKLAEQIQQLLPELSEHEALRQAGLMQAGSQLSRYPMLPTGPAAPRHRGNLDGLLPQGE